MIDPWGAKFPGSGTEIIPLKDSHTRITFMINITHLRITHF
jgi:hypothetical protein